MKTARLALIAAFALSACATVPPPAPEPIRSPAPTTVPAPATTPAIVPALDAYVWELGTARAASGQAIAELQPIDGRRLRLEFLDQRLGISGGCNRLAGRYRLQGESLRVGALMQTGMACADARLLARDMALRARLQGPLQLRRPAGLPPRLQLRTAAGDVLGFQGVPTAQTRFGRAGTTLFLEVAPARVACAQPPMPARTCLRVRERRYGSDGKLAGQGDWRPLYQEIEGYTHTPGARDVLRVQRYALASPPADAPAFAYVLDLVVESGRGP